MKYPELTLQTIETLVAKLGGTQGVEDLLSGYTKVTKVPPLLIGSFGFNGEVLSYAIVTPKDLGFKKDTTIEELYSVAISKGFELITKEMFEVVYHQVPHNRLPREKIIRAGMIPIQRNGEETKQDGKNLEVRAILEDHQICWRMGYNNVRRLLDDPVMFLIKK